MTALFTASGPVRHMLAAALFITVILQLFLCLYEQVCRAGRGKRAADRVILLVLTGLCACLMAANNGGVYPGWLFALVPPAAVISSIYALTGMRRAYRLRRDTLSASSVKEALDNLNSGILFSDADHRAVLVNYTMGDLAASLSGSYPQTLDDLYQAIDKAEALPDASGLYRFPDGRVWSFRTEALDGTGLEGFSQVTAQDVTELFSINRQLAAENAELNAAIEETRRMLDLVEDRVREQETLDIKVRVHNDIGKSLISLSELMNGGAGDQNEELHTLHKAVSLFSGGGPALPGTLEEVRRDAAEMGVTLITDGVIPKDDDAERLIASAARECVTNCVRHAKGNTVTVHTEADSGVYNVMITNDGEPPRGPVTEGGGLGSLRRSVEAAGGEMRVLHSPVFALMLKLKERRPRQ